MAPKKEESLEEIKKKADQLRQNYIDRRTLPPPPKLSAAERLERVRERLQRIIVVGTIADERRTKTLIQEMNLRLELGDWRRIYACAAEIAAVARARTLGLEGAHPVLPSERPPPASLGSGRPGPHEDES